MEESTVILLKDPSDCDAQSDLGTTGKDKGGREFTHRCELQAFQFSICRIGRSRKLLHLSALNFWILKEVDKATAREKPHLAYRPKPDSRERLGQNGSSCKGTGALQQRCLRAPGVAAGMSAVCYPSEASTEIHSKHFKTLEAISSWYEIQEFHSFSSFGGFCLFWGFLSHFTKVPVCNELEILKKKKKPRLFTDSLRNTYFKQHLALNNY